jgi:hypothetical protein
VDWLRRFGEWLVNVYHSLLNFYYKFAIAYGMGLMCSAATVALKDIAPIWPLGYYTLVWVLAFFFPGSAFLYSIFNLRVRFNEIQDVSQRNQFYFVYFPDLSKAEAERQFSRFLRRRFAEYYNLLELGGFSLVAGMIVFLAAFFLAVQLGLPDAIEPVALPPVVDTWLLVIGSSFFGALAGAYVLIYKRYRTFDIYPSTYLQVTVGVTVGTLAGGFVITLWPAASTTFIAFATGFLTAINVNFLPRLLRQLFAWVTGTKLPPEIPSDLHRVLQNSEAIESLNNVSLFSVAEFAKTEPIRLYLNMPQPIGVINGWMDEALLHYYFQSRIEDLRKVHVQRFTQLMELIVERFEHRGIRWRAQATVVGDGTIDAEIVRTVKTIVDSRVHHRPLGLLSENYRRAFFLP